MPARKSYGYNYYESGSAARKIDYTYDEKKARRKNVNKKAKAQPKSKAKASSVIMIVCVFTMALVLVYRYNIINEKNLKSQSLASDLTKAESALVTSQIDVEQNTDLNEIEAYAKQKLGMQKSDKNQTIYVDTSKTNNSVELQDESTFFQEIGDKISQFFGNLFK